MYGIALHRLPVAIALMTMLITSNIPKVKAWIILIIFGLTANIGQGLGFLAGDLIEEFDFNFILAIVVGMFLHISTTIIFETSENHKFNFIKLFAILAGGALAFLIH